MFRKSRAALLLLMMAGCMSVSLTSGVGTTPGQSAPPIVGSDAAGERLRLEDFKGKVVLLHFGFAHCPPCKVMIGRERELVRHYQNRPFAVLGISADETPEALKAFERREGITWRTWWDGPSGPIAGVWNVHAYPTLVLIDRDGVVRYRHVGLPPEGELEALIEKLIRVHRTT
jgi:peroxiredoxin